ncbi:hypothetical protein GF412_05430 [Candidatus Micrarchaeota archaeon]|nr:hypothetical protein [Candidatus Micrarchaeota archaeon]MBD3418393.1 hypothetical protein [Candidatus Micrarchaeota archaeon]
MHEHVTWNMIEEWVSAKREGKQQAEEIGELIIEVDKGMIGIKHPKTGLLQLVDPKDFGIRGLSGDAEIIVHRKEGGHYFVYLLNPGSDKLVLLEIIVEDAAFGVYPRDFELGENISSNNYVVIDSETLAICTKKVIFVVRGGTHIGITLEKAGVAGIENPVFGVGKSESHVWLAVMEKGAEEAVLVCLTDSDLGYAVRRKEKNELKDKELMEEEG